jgi:hypothetical protein
MAPSRVFVSYVQENRHVVARLVSDLRSRGAHVWFDKDALPAGVFWRDQIRTAVRDHEYFIACFSQEYAAREKTFMNEELELAIEEIRLRGTAPWFIPVLLSGEIPDRSIGATRTLRDIQFVDFRTGEWSHHVDEIARTVLAKRPPQRATVDDAVSPAPNRANLGSASVSAPVATFREKVETITIIAGGITIPRLIDELLDGVFVPFALPGISPLKVYRESETTFVDVTLYGGTTTSPLEIRRNEFVDRTPPGWDRNFSDAAIEVVNENGYPVFQLIYETPSCIRINGVLRNRRGEVVLNREGVALNPRGPVRPLKPIFRYPSWKFRSVYADDAVTPEEPIALTVTVEQVVYATVTSKPFQGQTIITMIATLTNQGYPATVGNYSLEVVEGTSRRTTTVRQDVPDTLALHTAEGDVLQGGDASLERKTTIFPLALRNSVTGVLLFIAPLDLDDVTRIGTQLVLRYEDMTGGNHEMVHTVKPVTTE